MKAGERARRWDDPVDRYRDRGVRPVRRRRSAARSRPPQSAGRKLYGFAEHTVTSSFLGTSTGLRLRHDQPTGKVDINAKSADLARSAWAGQGTRDFTDVDVAAHGRRPGPAAGLGRSGQVELPAGRYETLLPPTAVADLLIYLYWSAGAKDALDGRTRVQQAGRRHPGRRAAGQAAGDAAQRPGPAPG